jgi:tetrahydrodipicolinate N-succinyltransferase
MYRELLDEFLTAIDDLPYEEVEKLSAEILYDMADSMEKTAAASAMKNAKKAVSQAKRKVARGVSGAQHDLYAAYKRYKKNMKKINKARYGVDMEDSLMRNFRTNPASTWYHGAYSAKQLKQAKKMAKARKKFRNATIGRNAAIGAGAAGLGVLAATGNKKGRD